MAFCSQCGKELKDGEICSCRKTADKAVETASATATEATMTATATEATVTATEATMTATAAEAAETTITATATTTATRETGKSATQANVQAAKEKATEFANGIVGYVKEIIAKPTDGVKKFVDTISWLNMIIIMGVYAVINIVFDVISMIKGNITYKNAIKDSADDLDMDLDDYLDMTNMDEIQYEAGDFIKGILTDVLNVVAFVAVSAVVVYFAIKLIKKTQTTWQKAVAIAVVGMLISAPCTLITKVLGLLPSMKLISWVSGAVGTVRQWGSVLLMYLGVRSVCGDTDSAIKVMIPSAAVYSIVLSVVSFLINSLFY